MNNTSEKPIILGIESSCDDTSVSVLKGNIVLSNVTAGQKVHQLYGGVVPELASRAHQSNIVPVVSAALMEANLEPKDINYVAVTKGPGLLGSLLVGTSFAKSYAHALNIPLLGINHMEGHVIAHFISRNPDFKAPDEPFLCLTVSGGHTQIIIVKSALEMELLASTIDDAAGEALDKAAKVLGLPYPGGPVIDKLAKTGNDSAFKFPMPKADGDNYSFSGLKTSFLYQVRDLKNAGNDLDEKLIADLCASYQKAVVDYLLLKFKNVLKRTNAKGIAIAGGVSANSLLRQAFTNLAKEQNLKLLLPEFEFCTDNGAMIGGVAYYKIGEGAFDGLDLVPSARLKL